MGPRFLANPYPVYRDLRSADPVHWDDELNVWILTRYTDVASALGDVRLQSDRLGSVELLRQMGLEEAIPLFETLSRMILFSNPPEHTRLRKLVKKGLTAQVCETTQAHVERVTDALLDRALEAAISSPLRGYACTDLIREFAEPLPITVIADLFRVPPEDRERFKQWWYEVMACLKNAYLEPGRSRPAIQGLLTLTRHLRQVFDRIRAQPGDDLLSTLVRAEVEGERLSEEELFANCIFLLSVGQESVTNVIGNGVLALLRHRGQLRMLLANPALIAPAVEEFLRYESPVQYTGRLAKADVEIGGKQIRSGQRVMLVLGAANRDPARFPEPDRLDIARAENHHLAFGHGPHSCLGSMLARMEAQVAFRKILKRMPGLRLARTTVEWQPNLSSRGLASLPVLFKREPAAAPGALSRSQERSCRKQK